MKAHILIAILFLLSSCGVSPDARENARIRQWAALQSLRLDVQVHPDGTASFSPKIEGPREGFDFLSKRNFWIKRIWIEDGDRKINGYQALAHREWISFGTDTGPVSRGKHSVQFVIAICRDPNGLPDPLTTKTDSELEKDFQEIATVASPKVEFEIK
jgi:hypothetical protein